MNLLRASASSVVFALALTHAPSVRAAAILPSGFGVEQVGHGPFTGWGPSGFAFLPDGRLVMIDLQSGIVRLNAVGATSSVSIYTIPDVDFDGERGLLGVAVDPGWPARPYLYFFFSHTSNFGYVIMLTATGELTDPASTDLSLGSRFDILTDLRDNEIIHNGGTLRFGPDGMLYMSLGDDAFGCSAQDRFKLSGEILRIDVSSLPDSGGGPPPKVDITPSDNPFVGLGENEGLVWAWGLRNPFRFTIDEPTGDIYLGDVGTITWEEVDIVPFSTGGGENFAWPQLEGPDSTGNPSTCGQENPFTDPAYVYPHQGATSIICGPLYRPVPSSPVSFPESYDGSLFIIDHFHGWIRRLVDTGGGWDVAPPAVAQPSAENWAEGFTFYSDFQLGPDGALYLAHLVADGTPQGVFRIVRTAPTAVEEIASGTGVRAFPNPAFAGSGATFRWAVRTPGPHSLRVVDAAGRAVRTLHLVAGPGEGAARWDGRAAGGGSVFSGVYFYRLEDPKGRVSTGRLTVLR